MTSDRNRAIARIEELIETMDDPKAAYVVRSRLDRTMLVVRQHIQEIRGHDPATASQLLATVGRVDDSFSALRRRSEPFGDAWISKLGSTRIELALLRRLLTTE